MAISIVDLEKLEALAEIEREEETRKAYYQNVKFPFEFGLSVEGIEVKRKIKRATVCRLHLKNVT